MICYMEVKDYTLKVFISKNNIQPHYAVSTASAAKSIIGDKSKAAIGNGKTVELYDLEILNLLCMIIYQF